MSIVRSPRAEQHFTVLENELLRDSGLSYRARGILAAILSRPDNWRTTIDQLAREGREGRGAVATAMRELEAAGYVQRVKVRDERGQIRTVTRVFDRPQATTASGDENVLEARVEPSRGVGRTTGTGQQLAVVPDTENPVPVKPVAKKPAAKNPHPGLLAPLRSTDEEVPRRSTEKKKEITTTRATFDDFWAAYPRKVDKRTAAAAWKRATTREDPHKIVLAAERYAADPNREDAYTKHPSTWLNADAWLNAPLPAPSVHGGSAMQRVERLQESVKAAAWGDQ